jgi:hypothetical protein
MVSETQAWPWLAPWNFDALRSLFRFLPHTSFGIRLASFFLDNPLFTTWLYAAVSYVYWSKQDDRTSERRVQLLRIVAAFVLAIILAALLDLASTHVCGRFPESVPIVALELRRSKQFSEPFDIGLSDCLAGLAAAKQGDRLVAHPVNIPDHFLAKGLSGGALPN